MACAMMSMGMSTTTTMMSTSITTMTMMTSSIMNTMKMTTNIMDMSIITIITTTKEVKLRNMA